MNDSLRTLQRRSLIVAVVGVVVCAALSWQQPADLWRAYLAAYMLCWPVALGAAGLLAIGNLTGGNWATRPGPFVSGGDSDDSVGGHPVHSDRAEP